MKENQKSVSRKSSFHSIIQTDAFGGVLLIIFTLIALIWANSPFKDYYHHLWELPIGIEIGSRLYEMHLLHLINDGLMAIFFYKVGLEIKREIKAGELSSLRKSTLPALGALGGMVVPALVYSSIILLTGHPDAISGWGIPMATDIAFSLAIISLLGKRVPLALKVFLVALAIVDDMGAILVIAFFYTSNLHLGYFFIALGIIAFLVLLNKLKFRYIPVYHILGLVIWGCFYASGIHATIAGVALAFTIPISRELDLNVFRKRINELEFIDKDHTEHTLAHHHIEKITEIKRHIRKLESPVQRLEHSLHSTVNFLIMPLFALANAGVTINNGHGMAFSVVTVAVVVALFVGKPLGITLFAWIGVKLGIAELPQRIKIKQLMGVAILGGLGFTMSIFIATLAFTNDKLLDEAKIGILLGSIIAGVVGYQFLNRMFKR